MFRRLAIVSLKRPDRRLGVTRQRCLENLPVLANCISLEPFLRSEVCAQNTMTLRLIEQKAGQFYVPARPAGCEQGHVKTAMMQRPNFG